MKKYLGVFLSLLILVGIAPTSVLFAESACEIDPDSQECKIEIAREKSEKINEMYKEMASVEDDLEEAQALASKYYNEAVALEEEIEKLTVEMDALQAKIEELTARIIENEEKKETINKRVLNRMENAQATMHFNPLLDFVLGSKGFSDMLRRTYGVEAIMSKEANDREELVLIIEQLTKDKQEVEEAKAKLDKDKEELVEKKAEYIVKMEYYDRIADELKERIAEIRNSLESEKISYRELLGEIEDISSLPTSDGWYYLFNKGVGRYTGYFPRYDGDSGDIHLGLDYGVPRGTEIHAPATSIVLVKYNGCKDPGYLGCDCGGDGNGNGVNYGGNQLYIMTSVYNKVYAISFNHLNVAGTGNSATDFKIGDIVYAGDVIGKTGSSGNSTGPHLHLELFYLGPGDWEDIQNIYLHRNYSSSFNCGWGTTGYYSRCSVTGEAPCRLDPIDYLPLQR